MPVSRTAATLFEKGLITRQQLDAIREQELRGIFSLHNEIRLLLFLSILLFSGGAGILIYKNIDSIGHAVILSGLFLITCFCFYYCFRHAKGFSKEKLGSEKPVYDYIVLAANVLSGIFMGYLQVQYTVFGTRYGVATLVPTLLYFFSAYYFDHKGVLSLALSGLFAVIGFSTDPEAILEMDFTGEMYLSYAALALCAILIGYTRYAQKAGLKKHFNVIYLNFALHIGSIVCIANLFSSFSILYSAAIAAIAAYFVYAAYQKASLIFMVFSLVYGYIAFNILLSRFVVFMEFSAAVIYLTPFYLAGSIFFFRMCLKNFKEKTRHADI